MADMVVELEFAGEAEELWDPSREGGRSYPNGVYKCKGKSVELKTKADNGNQRYEIQAEILEGPLKGQTMHTVLFADFSKAANKAKLVTGLQSVGVPMNKLVGTKKIDIASTFTNRPFLLYVKNAPEGEMVEYKGQLKRPLPEIGFITAAQVKKLSEVVKTTTAAGKPPAKVPNGTQTATTEDIIAGASTEAGFDNLFDEPKA